MKTRFILAITFLAIVVAVFNFVSRRIFAQEYLSEQICGDGIIINEIIQDPDAVTDANGEWFEVYNTTDTNLNLRGCTISDAGSDSYVIGADLVVPVSGYAVLAKNGDLSTNGGVSVNYVYSGFTLGNSGDEIIITCCGMEVDRVEYDGGVNWPDPIGASMVLANYGFDNNVGNNWCVATSVYGNGDLGTPGGLNDSCSGGQSICGNDILELDEECDDGNSQDNDGCSKECMLELACDNGVQNGDEEGIDCGGSCTNQDCCSNGYWDENLGEGGVDCGGECSNIDRDNDGYSDIACGGTDFDDQDPACYPGAQEICDAKDNNNNGVADEGFLDFDNDGEVDCIDTDDDDDGVVDGDDLCFGTLLPESILYKKLIFQRYIDIDGDGIFETRKKPFSLIVDSQYNLQKTHGCSCEQILGLKPGINLGEKMFGCLEVTIKKFVDKMGWAK